MQNAPFSGTESRSRWIAGTPNRLARSRNGIPCQLLQPGCNALMPFVMRVRRIDPLQDSRWEEFLRGQAQASLFHTPAWLRALHLTYGYEPVAFTTSASNAPLSNGIVFCRIKSMLTGTRL